MAVLGQLIEKEGMEMKKPFYLITVMIAGGFMLLVADVIFVKLMMAEGPPREFWVMFAGAIFVNAVLIAICSIPVYFEGVKRGCGRLLLAEYLQPGGRFKITDSFFDVLSGNTYVLLFTGALHKICQVPYKLPEGTTHLRVVGNTLSSQFQPIEVVPEDVRVLSP